MFEGNSMMINDYHIPVLKEQKLQAHLSKLLELSQGEISIKPTKQNLSLIECLSTKKTKNDRVRNYQNHSMIQV